jgi:hypothetical protein
MTGRKVTGKVSPPASAVVHFYPIDGFPQRLRGSVACARQNCLKTRAQRRRAARGAGDSSAGGRSAMLSCDGLRQVHYRPQSPGSTFRTSDVSGMEFYLYLPGCG